MVYLHNQNVIHRDLKPANILVSLPSIHPSIYLYRILSSRISNIESHLISSLLSSLLSPVVVLLLLFLFLLPDRELGRRQSKSMRFRNQQSRSETESQPSGGRFRQQQRHARGPRVPAIRSPRAVQRKPRCQSGRIQFCNHSVGDCIANESLARNQIWITGRVD